MDPPEYHKMSHIPFLEGEELERESYYVTVYLRGQTIK
jgi:hypothetical protein